MLVLKMSDSDEIREKEKKLWFYFVFEYNDVKFLW